MKPDAPTYEELMSRNVRYVATGDTYPHRELFVSWAWHWDPDRRVWIEDNHREPDYPGIQIFRDLPGVTVTEEPDT